MSKGIVIIGGQGGTISRSTVVGCETGIEVTGSTDFNLIDNKVISAEALRLFNELEVAIHQLDVDEDKRSKCLSSLRSLGESAGTPSFGERYREFMAVASDHMSVLAPLLAPLAGALV